MSFGSQPGSDSPVTADDLVVIAGALLARVRANAPRVHAITNAAAQVFTANLLLAAGAIPSLTHAAGEVGAIAARADALVVNLGTLDAERRAGIPVAIEAARAHQRPWLLDPTHADGNPVRLDFASGLLAADPAILRCSAAEFAALAGVAAGPDTLRAFAARHGIVVAVTGETDLVADSGRVAAIRNGHPLMSRVTAVGCAGASLAAAFATATRDAFAASAAALLVLGVAGEIAGREARGPGSFQPAFLDALYALDADQLTAAARVEIIGDRA